MDHLKFRRQFILSNQSLNTDKSWRTVHLKKSDSSFRISVHPDLNVCENDNQNFHLVLLGYILNPSSPEKSDQDILNDLAGEGDFLSVVKSTHAMNGRFVIIYNDKSSVKLFNDATGLREIYYIHTNDTIACGSTPDIIAKYHSIPVHQDKQVSEFFNAREFNNDERIWVGEDTVYKDVKHLLPNHYLDLSGNKVDRFWPTQERKIIKLNDLAEYAARTLKGTFDAACNRYELYQGLTSGWETRLFLSACKKHTDKIHFYFFRGYKRDTTSGVSMDYEVARQIAEKNNIPLEVLLLDDVEIDKNFETIYYQNNVLARANLLPIYYDAFRKKLDNTKTVSGSMGNEIVRLLSNIDRKIVDPYKIARKFHYEKYPYAVEAINKWMKESIHLRDMNHVMIDLFNWEQYIGNWGALSSSEQDIVRDEMRPFNNRELLATFISLKDKFRHRDYPLGYVKTIGILWKDLLDFKMDIDMYRFKKFLRFFDLERLADRTYQRLK